MSRWGALSRVIQERRGIAVPLCAPMHQTADHDSHRAIGGPVGAGARASVVPVRQPIRLAGWWRCLVNGFERVDLAIERLSTDPSGACRLEAVGAHEGQPFSLLVVVRPATPTGPLQLVATGEADRSLLAGLLGLTSRDFDSRPLGYSQNWWRVV